MTKTYAIGKHIVLVTVEPGQSGADGATALKFTAVCDGLVERTGMMTLNARHDMTQPELDAEVETFARRLADEAAGVHQTQDLAEKMVGKAPAKASGQTGQQ